MMNQGGVFIGAGRQDALTAVHPSLLRLLLLGSGWVAPPSSSVHQGGDPTPVTVSNQLDSLCCSPSSPRDASGHRGYLLGRRRDLYLVHLGNTCLYLGENDKFSNISQDLY